MFFYKLYILYYNVNQKQHGVNLNKLFDIKIYQLLFPHNIFFFHTYSHFLSILLSDRSNIVVILE